MQLTPDADQQAFVGELRRLLTDMDALGRARQALGSADGFDRELWAKLAELGLGGLTIAEQYDGAGFGWFELALAVEELGGALSVGPLIGTACAAELLAGCDYDALKARWLPHLASGQALLGIADCESPIMETAWADGLLFCDESGVRLAEGTELETLAGLDGTRGLAKLPNNMGIGVRIAVAQGHRERVDALRLMLGAADAVGVADKALALSVAYGHTREQFGRPIGSFQAYKHRCADMLVKVESARSAMRAAAWAADNDPDRLAMWAGIAARVCGDNAAWVTGECIQLHGGIGFCWEHDAHLLFKRAQAGRTFARVLLRREVDFSAFWRDGGALPDTSNRALPAVAAELQAWLAANLVGEFAALRNRGGPGDEVIEQLPLRRRWEQHLALAGWNCLSWPKEHGGRGLTLSEQVAVNEVYAAGGGPGRLGHIGETLLGPTLIELGTDAQQRRFLPGIRAAEALWCQGYSEPDAGSDLANVRTTAVLDGDVWRITGQKVWTSHAAWSDWCFVLCRVGELPADGKTSKHRNLAYILVPMAQDAITTRPIEQLTGTGEFFEVFFDGAVTAKDNIVGAPGEGWRIAMATLMHERGASTLSQQIGFARELDAVIAAAKADGCIDEPLIADRLARAWIGLQVMRASALRSLADVQRGELGKTAVINKLYWSHWHRDLGELAMDVLGDDGLLLADKPYELHELQRLFLFSRADTIYAGTSEIQRNIIAERALGLPREPR